MSVSDTRKGMVGICRKYKPLRNQNFPGSSIALYHYGTKGDLLSIEPVRTTFTENVIICMPRDYLKMYLECCMWNGAHLVAPWCIKNKCKNGKESLSADFDFLFPSQYTIYTAWCNFRGAQLKAISPALCPGNESMVSRGMVSKLWGGIMLCRSTFSEQFYQQRWTDILVWINYYNYGIAMSYNYSLMP